MLDEDSRNPPKARRIESDLLEGEPTQKSVIEQLKEAIRLSELREREAKRQLAQSELEKEELRISLLRSQYLESVKRKKFENDIEMLDYLDKAQMVALASEVTAYEDYSQNQSLSQNYFVESSRHSVQTSCLDISKLRRHHMEPNFFHLRSWLTNPAVCEAILRAKFEDEYRGFILREVDILNRIRSAIVFLRSADVSMVEVDHVEPMYILYKGGFLRRLREVCPSCPDLSVVPTNSEPILSMTARVVISPNSESISKVIKGYSDVCTGIFDGIISTNQIRTIEELKVPGAQLRSQALAAKDQSLFEVACLGNMNSKKDPSTFFFGCLTDFFSIRISAFHHGVHFLAPSAIQASTYIFYQLAIHLLTLEDFQATFSSDAEVGVLGVAVEYAESCDDDEENDVAHETEEKNEEPQPQPQPRSRQQRFSVPIRVDEDSIDFGGHEATEKYWEDVMALRDWSHEINGRVFLSANNLRKYCHQQSSNSSSSGRERIISDWVKGAPKLS